MNPSLRSLLFTTFITLFGLSAAWIYLYQKGLAKPITPLQHKFFTPAIPDGQRLLIAHGGDPTVAPANSLAALSAAATIDPRIVLWADVEMSADGQIVLSPGKELLGDALEQIPQQRFVLNVLNYRPGLDTALSKVIENANASERILIQSETDGLLKDLRTLHPMWLFGSSRAQLTQLRMLLTIGLGPITPLRADVYVSVNFRDRPPLMDESLITEIHRRRMKAIVGPAANRATRDRWIALGIDGLISTNPRADVDVL